jgi:hypothetical protein
VRIREIKGDLNIFIGIFDEDDAVAVDVGALPFAFEEDGAAFLDLGRSKVCLLEKRNDVLKRERLQICGGFLLLGRRREKGPSDQKGNDCEPGFHALATADLSSARSRLGTTKTGQDACRTTYSAVLPQKNVFKSGSAMGRDRNEVRVALSRFRADLLSGVTGLY